MKKDTRFDAGPQIRQAMRDNPPMKREEEQRVARLARAGDTKARERLVLCNLGIVIMHLRKRMAASSLRLEDLIQYGVLGLMRAADKFDPDRGFRFSTYAVGWINAFLDGGIGQKEQIIRLAAGRARMWARLRAGEKPPVVLSLDVPMNDDSGTTWADALESHDPSQQDRMEREQNRAQVFDRLREAGFTPREIDIIESRLMRDEPEGLASIGARYGVCRERIRQLQEKLLPRLRKHFQDLAA